MPADIRDRTFEFACVVVRFCRELARREGCRRIADQLLDAGTSIGANVEEAKCAYSRREFTFKNSLALKEARETRYWLRIIHQCRLVPDADVLPLLQEAGELVGILTATVKKARQHVDEVRSTT